MNQSVPSDAGLPRRKSFFGHPRELGTLFTTEMWERFSFYGMRAILVLFLTAPASEGGWGWDPGDANSLYGVYNGFVYLTALPGAWVADRLIGSRRSVLWGGVIIAAGHYCLALQAQFTFFLGLILIVSGSGLLKPNMSAMVGELYAKDDPKRDAGFSVFYMGINIGAFAAPLIVGPLAEGINWHLGFAAAGIGMTIGILWYILGARSMGEVGKQVVRPLDAREKTRFVWLFPLGAVLVLVVGLGLLFGLMAGFSMGALPASLLVLTFVPIVVAVAYFWRMLADREISDDERSRLRAYIYLFLFAVCFWLIYDQAGSVLNIFTEREINREVPLLGELSAATFQAINPIFIIVGAPLSGWVWLKAGHRLSTPLKFTIGLVLNGFSFILMGLAAQAAIGPGAISPLWIVAVYAVQVAGELSISPVGLSTTTKLAPTRYYAQMMGLWFLSTAVGDAIGGQVARAQAVFGDPTYFTMLGGTSIVLGVAAVGLTRHIGGLMRGIH